MLIFKIRVVITSVFLAIFLSGCVTTQVKNTETNSNEAVIFGRVIITGEKDINYQYMTAHLYSENGSPIVAQLDKGGYFYTKAPLGKFYLDFLEYNNIKRMKSYSIPTEYTFADIAKTDEVYYIGDINLKWSPDSNYQTDKITFKIEKPLRERVPAIPADVRMDNNTMEKFLKKFPQNKKPIRISILNSKY
ncbi:hypothetical protein [Prevotella sp. 10(H)]|uniref:hypothetical protein n=1 Tax=Prevotella sp. 10(H) TaxID=1158294 RepID=UPI0004A706F0|nr:hypothetical protein [Prevotella sp. 10(H)]